MSQLLSENEIAHFSDISARFGDSFYLLDRAVFSSNFLQLKAEFQKYYAKTNIAYSYKTNYIPKLVQVVNMLGGFAEVVSDMELDVALRSGVGINRIIWNGPIKSEERVKQLLLSGGTVNLDSIEEAKEIITLARTHPDKTINIGVRCNYDVGDGVLSRFGFDVEGEDFDSVMRLIASEPNVQLKELQAHFAKRTAELWSARTRGMLEIYDRVCSQYRLRPEILDIGGGIFGKMPESLRTQLGISKVSFGDYASKAAKLFSEHFAEEENAPWLFIEPGTALAGDCMKFVCRVRSIKKIQGKTIATVTGSQKNISMAGINPPLQIVSGGGERYNLCGADIAGFTCIESDYLYKNYSGPLGVGDYVVFGNCGSYSIVMKPPFILPNFPVIEVAEDSVEVIKRAESFEDVFRTYFF